MRRLILDKHSLVDKVARSHGFVQQYGVGGSRTPLDFMQPVIATRADGVDPDTSHLGEVLTLTKEAFLKYPVAYVKPTMYTVKDFIRFGAHVLGGVHAGDPEHHDDQVLLAFNQQFQIGGEDGCIRTLRAIARVVHRGLVPLRQQIIASDSA
ncbi:MAG TPA: hypothetical protein VJ874_01800 [Candidatus Thermoplasmatota archaeon]|nr:hypothetical protein [Candidatus Thermoplasmatota archaeon]